MEWPAEKRCSSCNDIKATTEFAKDRSHSDGLRSSCESCRHARLDDMRLTKEPNSICQYGNHPFYVTPAEKARGGDRYCSREHRMLGERAHSATLTEKPCKVCGIPKLLDEFDAQPLGLGGRRSVCKTCTAEQGRIKRRALGVKALPNKTLRHCAYGECSNFFSRSPSILDRYCSRFCRLEDQRTPSGMCHYCAQSFAPQPNAVKNGDGRFCSRQHGAATRKNQVECVCAYCHKTFPAIVSVVAKGGAQHCSEQCKWNHEAREQLAHFWSHVDQSRGHDACWPWIGSTFKDRDGYGQFFLCGKNYRAHRIAFMLVKGPLQDDDQSLHRCDNPPCCNPQHLFKGTNLDNIRDRDAKGRQATGDHTPYERRARGERSGTAKLTEATARELYALKGTMSQEKAGAMFHIDQTVVSDLWNHKTWKHIHNYIS